MLNHTLIKNRFCHVSAEPVQCEQYASIRLNSIKWENILISKIKKGPILLIILIISTSSHLWANQSMLEKRVYVATRVNSLLPVIDGHLDDPVWQGGNWAGDFIQRKPLGGMSPSQNTAFKILYDDYNLYVAIRAFDTEPEKIERRVARRDEFAGDIVGLCIDSYYDHRTGFEFNVTAAGGKADLVFFDDGKRRDRNWNAIYFAKVAMEDSAWTTEMRIPFSQLRFGVKDEQVWGLHVWRKIHRKQEEDNWQYLPLDAPGKVSLFGILRGIKGIKTPRRIELLPYTIGKLQTFQKKQGNPFTTGHLSNIKGGLDGKIGIRSDLILDFTIYPDFGQVETDPSVMNLTAFETFYTEQRPFFIEGRNILDLQLDSGSGQRSDILFYSRRIGHAPSYHPDLESNEHVKMPEMTSIISALTLTGKTKDGLSIGIMESVTAEENAEIADEVQRRSQTVEPLASYFVGRVQKDYDDGNTIIGGMFTATNRNISAEHLEFLNRSAYSGGLDLLHQWSYKSYYLNIKTAFSHIRGDPKALTEIQSASSHYFQRPDAKHVTLDSNRTYLSGHGGHIEIGRGGNGNWRFAEGVSWRSPGLELNDLGYLRLADIIKQHTKVGYEVKNQTGIFRNYSMSLNQYKDWNFAGENIQTRGSIGFKAQFTNYWSVSAELFRNMAFLDTRVARGGPALKFKGNWNSSYTFSSDTRGKLTFKFKGRNFWFDDGISKFNEFNPDISLRVSSALSLSGSFSYRFNRDNLQYVMTENINGENRYIFARINQKTLGITFRLNYNLTPELSIQYYGQPFLSAGETSFFKKITNPRVNHYEDRFHTFSEHEIAYDPAKNEYLIDEDQDGNTDYSIDSPDFSFREFRSNLVIRWEYKTGSTLYLVWSQGRTEDKSSGDFSARNDLQELFDIYPHNVFLIKFSHWFSL